MKAWIVTMGCPKNLVDSEATMSVLRTAGCEMAENPAEADLLLVGACSFLDASWRETVEEVTRLDGYRENGDGKRLVLMGCLPRHRPEDLEDELPSVDHFLPTGAHDKLPGLIASWGEGAGVARTVDAAGSDRFAGFAGRDLLTPSHTAYVKAGEGCNRNCSFCAIPTIRGRQITRPVRDIVAEVGGLVDRGVREVTLLSQDIVSYRSGRDRLFDLIAGIAGAGVDWLRIMYVHPAGLTPDYLERIFQHPAVCRYLEMPIQHASSRLLARMNRGYDRPGIERLISGARTAYPELVIRSEVIVGFPGETEDDFEELKDFVQEFEFDSLGIFPYSPEPGTDAASMEDAVSPAEIRSRVAELATAQEAVSFGARSRFIGEHLPVLVDRRLEGDEVEGEYRFSGRFYGQALEVDGEVLVAPPPASGGIEVGSFADVRIIDADTCDLRGIVE